MAKQTAEYKAYLAAQKEFMRPNSNISKAEVNRLRRAAFPKAGKPLDLMADMAKALGVEGFRSKGGKRSK